MPKVKFFVWHLINGCIPVCSELVKKGIQVDNICPVCGDQDETLFHVFFTCKLSMEVKKCYNLEGMTAESNLWGGLEEWGVLFKWLKENDLLDIWMLATWQIWNNRNQCVHNFSCKKPSKIANSVCRLNEDMVLNTSISQEGVVLNSIGWQAPPEGVHKLNVDATYSVQHKYANMGMVVRDYRGSIVLCIVKQVEGVDSPLHAKLKAILFGLEECRNIMANSVLIESDFLLAIREIERGQDSFSEWTRIISDLIRHSQIHFVSRFSHVR
ncbi:hypothetical protein CRYUN_Cryun03dG0076400 [Craigia yunnanensis]